MGNHEMLEEMIDEISMSYVDYGELYNRKTTVVDTYFASKIAESLYLDPEPKSMAECQKRIDWVKWKDAIDAELRSLNKRNVLAL